MCVCLLGWSVAVIAGTVLPYLADRDRRLLAPDLVDDEDADETPEEKEFKRIKEMVQEWKAEAKRDKKPVKLPIRSSFFVYFCLV